MLHRALLVVHITSGIAGLILGVFVGLAAKRRGRHTRLGRVYYTTVLVICVSAMSLSLLKWSEAWWLFLLAAFTCMNAMVGFIAARRRWRAWLVAHIAGMGGSYIALVSALGVALAERPTFWAGAIPSFIGVPVIAAAIYRSAKGPLRPHVVTGASRDQSSFWVRA